MDYGIVLFQWLRLNTARVVYDDNKLQLFSFHVFYTNYQRLFPSNAVQNDNLVCSFPEWMNKQHREWRSVGDELPGLLQASPSFGMTITSMHVNKRGHSLRFHNSESSTLESHATCHKLERKNEHMSKIVAHIKSGW